MFSNLKIIDVSTVLAGPSVGTFFAELGASVLKIEHPLHSDVTRNWKLPSEPEKETVSAYFSSVNFRKEYLTLDLKNSTDHAQFIELVSTADILLSNFKKGDDVKLNITDDQIRAKNPKLIHGKINGFGSESDRVAYDLILQAETGFMSMNGTPESGPIKMPVALIDVLAAHHLKEGLLIALMERLTSKVGKTVSVSLYDAAVCSLANQASNFLMEHHVARRIGSMHPNIAPYGELFETNDAELITFAIGSDAQFNKLCKFLSLASTANDKRFNDNPSRVKNRSALAAILQEEIKKQSSDGILSAMNEQFVPVGKIMAIDNVFEQEKAKKLIRRELIQGKETARVTSIGFKWE